MAPYSARRAGNRLTLLRLRMERHIQRRNVAAAPAAEIEALCDRVTARYVKRPKIMGTAIPHRSGSFVSRL